MSTPAPATELTVPAALDGERADRALAALLDVSRSQAAATIDAGRVTRGDAALGRSARLATGDRLVVAAAEEPTARPLPPLPPIRYRDEHLLVIAKPPGLVVHPGPGHRDGTLVDVLRAAGIPLAPAGGPERPGIVHRLDRDTSGLMIVASTDAAHSRLVAMLKARTVARRYLALVEGSLPAERGRVDAPIGRHPVERKRFAVVETGRAAVTRWRVLADGEVAGERVTLARCRLETGRTHQIRVHLGYAGCPVAGDRTYGARPDLAAALGLQRPFLHAVQLGFEHPVTAAPIELAEPLPDDLVAALAVAGIAPPA